MLIGGPLGTIVGMRTPKLWPALLSLGLGSLILILKFIAAHWTGSLALRSDAVESIVNVVAAGMALGALRLSNVKADSNHPYGHGKIEHFSASFEGAVMAVAAFWIILEAVHGIARGSVPHDLGPGLWLNFGAGLLNGGLGLVLIHQGRLSQSHALVADGHHVLSDFYTTLGLLAGMLLARATGWMWMDPAMALAMGVLLGVMGMRLLYRSGLALMDTEDPELIKRITEGMQKIRPPELITAHGLRTLRSGHVVHVDLHAVVPEYLEVRAAHDGISDFCLQVLKSLHIEGEFHTHLDPCQQAYCSQCRMPECPIRLAPFEHERPLTPQMVTIPEVYP